MRILSALRGVRLAFRAGPGMSCCGVVNLTMSWMSSRTQ